jgi:hypothetical protein
MTKKLTPFQNTKLIYAINQARVDGANAHGVDVHHPDLTPAEWAPYLLEALEKAGFTLGLPDDDEPTFE